MEDYKVRQTGPEVQEALDQTTMNKNDIAAINSKLPEAASPENPLTDKAYVDGKVGEETTARQEAVETEAQNRQQAYQTLDGKIGANTQAIATEKTRAEGAEGVLDGKIDDNTQAIATEKTRAEGAEGVLDGKIAAEAQARQQADQTLDGKIGANTQAIATEKTRAEGVEQVLQTAIDTINGKIPAQATAQNQLADKDFVNSSISTATADFKGTYNSLQELEQVTANANDYAFVIATDAAGNTVYKRYKWVDGTGWTWEYDLNNSSFTAAQWAAIQSGITASLVTKLGDLPTNAELNQRISTAITTALGQYYTKTEIDTALATINTAIGQKANIDDLENGDVVPALAGNLESWADNNVPVENNFDAVIRTTAGDDPINSDDGGVLKSIVPITDFACTGLLATAENQLRLKSNGGGAVAVGAGWYFPVPKLTLGTFGTTDENNGLLLVDNTGANIQNATVYFKALSSGVPTSVTDGTQLTPQTVNYGDKTYKVYTTSGPGYIIVSGITYANTCARIAWEDWYDKFVSPTDPNDVGGSINLAPLFAAAPNGTGKFIVCGRSATYAERISATQWKITDPIGRIAEPVWTNTPNEVAEGETQTYTHTLAISDLANGGTALIEGSAQSLSVDGTTVSYNDTNATAISGAVRYEKAVAATATVNLASAYTLNDVGVEMKEGAEGEANFVCEYSQNIADSLAMAPPRLNDLRKTAAAVSLGYGICTTGTYDAAKVVTIPHFMLLENGTINVLFTAPINTENSTLNVSLTGAKPIRILGQNLPAGVIKAETYVTMAYDGVAWNIVNLFCPDASFDPAALLVDMGLPSGTKWAARDIDLTKPGGFCETPFTYEKSFFSWGNIDGHNPTSNSSFSPWNWGGINQAEPWYYGQVYGGTPGNTLTGNIAVGEAFDAARANLGAPWRMPTDTEYGELFSNIDYLNADGTVKDSSVTNKLSTVNGIVGIWIQSKINGARLFFSCSGYGSGTSRNNRGSSGDYWSSTWVSARRARGLDFGSGGVNPQNSYSRYYGFAVRAVQ